MRAVTQTRYGNPQDVLALSDVPAPAPGHGQVSVRVRAASVRADAWHAVTGLPLILRLMGSGVRGPKQTIPGTDVAGTVEAVGAGVGGFAVGDAVFGECGTGFQWANAGAFALSAGHRVLINGSAGALGSLALQIAKTQGAHVTAVDGASKLPYLQQLGADATVDYRQQPVVQLTDKFDLIYDIASTLSVSACRHLFREGGKFVMIGHDQYGALGRTVLGSVPAAMGLALAALWNPHLPKPIFTAPDRTKGALC